MCGIILLVNVVIVSSDTEVGARLHVERVEANNKPGGGDIGLGKGNDLGSLGLGVIPETNILGVERHDSRHINEMYVGV